MSDSETRPSPSIREPELVPLAAILTRGTWLVGANIALIVLAMLIVQREPWQLSWLDLAFWSTVAAGLVARYLDVRLYGGTTVDHQPATLSHVRRHAFRLGGVAAAAWVVGQSVAI